MSLPDHTPLLHTLRRHIHWRLLTTLAPRAPADPPPPFDFCVAELLGEDAALDTADRPLALPEQLALALAAATHLQPHLLGDAVAAALPEAQDFSVIGGTKSADGRYVLPTGETVLFLAAGDDLAARRAAAQVFAPAHRLAGVLALANAAPGEPRFGGRLLLDEAYVDHLAFGHAGPPGFSAHFPAQRLTTRLTWSDLVLAEAVRDQLATLEAWLAHDRTLREEWGMGARLKRGYRVLFYGPPGTGKTLTATLLGERTGRTVLRVDLSAIVSKYIGETEKNLARVFDRAGRHRSVLFFDEADALFGKRTDVKSSHDRFANQGVSYLLQRVEDFDGLVILATNLRQNIDAAFLRRFNAVIHFAFPDEDARASLWNALLPAGVAREGGGELAARAARYKLAGGGIVNVVQRACLESLRRGERCVRWADVRAGIRLEVEKSGQLFREIAA